MTSTISWRLDWIWRVHFQCGNSHTACLSVFTKWQLVSLRYDPRECKAEILWTSLRSHTRLFLQCMLLVTYVSPVYYGRRLEGDYYGRRLYDSMNTKRWGSVGTILDVARTASFSQATIWFICSGETKAIGSSVKTSQLANREKKATLSIWTPNLSEVLWPGVAHMSSFGLSHCNLLVLGPCF